MTIAFSRRAVSPPGTPINVMNSCHTLLHTLEYAWSKTCGGRRRTPGCRTRRDTGRISVDRCLALHCAGRGSRAGAEVFARLAGAYLIAVTRCSSGRTGDAIAL